MVLRIIRAAFLNPKFSDLFVNEEGLHLGFIVGEADWV